MTAPPQGVQTEQLGFQAGTIRYHHAGTTGPAVVLLHGGGIDNALLSWRHAIAPLAVDHRVYLPDLPRHGGSRNWYGKVGQRTLEEVLRWLLDAWGVERAVLIGASVGGSAAIGFALRHPHRVRGLVLTGSEGLRHRVPGQLATYLKLRSRFFGTTAANVLGLHRGLSRRYLLDRVLNDPGEVIDHEQLVNEFHEELRGSASLFSDWYSEAVERRGMRINHLPHLGNLRCPVGFVHGERDERVPLSTANEAAAAVTGSTLRVLPGAGHWCHRERPNEFNAAVREFVNGTL